jgi:small neutral amino acid transporter SnatA (MarC family)
MMLAIVNPTGAVPFFLALSQGLKRAQRMRILRVSAFSAFCLIAASGVAVVPLTIPLLADGLVELLPIPAIPTLRT